MLTNLFTSILNMNINEKDIWIEFYKIVKFGWREVSVRHISIVTLTCSYDSQEFTILGKMLFFHIRRNPRL